MDGEAPNEGAAKAKALDRARTWLIQAERILADDVRARTPVKGAPRIPRLNWWRPDAVHIKSVFAVTGAYTLEPGCQCGSPIPLPAAVRGLDRLIEGGGNFGWRAGAVEGQMTTRPAAREAAVDSSLEQTRKALAELALEVAA